MTSGPHSRAAATLISATHGRKMWRALFMVSHEAEQIVQIHSRARGKNVPSCRYTNAGNSFWTHTCPHMDPTRPSVPLSLCQQWLIQSPCLCFSIQPCAPHRALQSLSFFFLIWTAITREEDCHLRKSSREWVTLPGDRAFPVHLIYIMDLLWWHRFHYSRKTHWKTQNTKKSDFLQ